MIKMIKFTLVLFGLLVNAGCENSVPEFSGDRAFMYLEKQCSFGPRNPGSDGYYACMNYLIDELNSKADTVWTQTFTYVDPYRDDKYNLSNIIARFNPNADKQILLGAHWDTRPWADKELKSEDRNKPIIGANDGASGVAVLLALAEVFHNHDLTVGITLVLFDGEDLGMSGESESYAQGSVFFSKNLPIPKPDYAIILDMVGDTYLHFPIERFSYQQAPKLVRSLWKLANRLNLPAFDQSLGYSIYDDHVPLWKYAGIPAVDIIDFDYPNRYSNYWHTHQDLPDKCSPSSLEQVGTLLVHHIYGIE
ncbi:MAG: M28 family peptidase [Candidatus Marinimicrobia bacterium]|nr:M28 family peptidase [Candidatus Neomarinimicrobiota bacterium]MCH7764108.1 M28 family peptidase [Candidatus Neomarinimicrobiota bacterium]